MKKILLPAFLLAFTTNLLHAQHEKSVFTSTGRAGVSTSFVTDYHAVGINPANLGLKSKYEVKHVTFGFLETGTNLFVEGLNVNDFLDNTSGGGTDLGERVSLAQKFNDKALSINLDMAPFGIAVQTEKLGGFAFSINENVKFFSNFSYSTSDFLFRGAVSELFENVQTRDGVIRPNDPSQYEKYMNDYGGISKGIANDSISLGRVLDGSKIQMHWYREYNFSYGKEIFNKNDILAVNVGIGLKYLQGFNYVNINAENGRLTGDFALNPLIGFDSITSVSSPSAIGGNKYQKIGQGFGADLGVTLLYKEKIKLGIALTNIGSIKYTGNVYAMRDTAFKEVSFEEESFSSFGDLIKVEGKEELVVKLPTMLRIGASHMLEDKMEIGFDVILPFNDVAGSFDRAIWAVGTDIKPVRWIKLSTGFNFGGNYDNKVNVPFGFTFIVGENGSWETGIASRDVISYFKGVNPTYSIAFGFFRFRV